jgi:hypothetical protein
VLAALTLLDEVSVASLHLSEAILTFASLHLSEDKLTFA